MRHLDWELEYFQKYRISTIPVKEKFRSQQCFVQEVAGQSSKQDIESKYFITDRLFKTKGLIQMTYCHILLSDFNYYSQNCDKL